MAKMDDQEIRAFLSHGTRTGKLATTRRDGRPHVTPIWFVLDGDDDTPPFSFVLLEGTVRISEDLDELRRWASLIGGRYMGEDRAEEFGQRNGVPGELLVRLTPTRTIGEHGVAD